MITRTLFHFALSLVLFLLVNWIGRHSYSRGYMSMELLPRNDEAPALNASIRILTPLVYLVLVAALLYGLDLDTWAKDLYWVAILYVLFRWSFNTVMGRVRLLNWGKEVVYAVAIIGGAILLSTRFLSSGPNLLPDPVNLVNELWILVALYLFYVANQIQVDSSGTEYRKRKYIIHRANSLRQKFSEELEPVQENQRLEALTLAVMIYESFNRPRIARAVEWLLHPTGRARTLGIMQVTTDERIDDRESVRRGAAKIRRAWVKHRMAEGPSWKGESQVRRNILLDYNPDMDYVSEVCQVMEVIEEDVLPATSDRLWHYEALMT